MNIFFIKKDFFDCKLFFNVKGYLVLDEIVISAIISKFLFIVFLYVSCYYVLVVI